MDESQLSREEKIELLQRLRGAVKQMHAQLLLQPAQVRNASLPAATGWQWFLGLIAIAQRQGQWTC